MSMSRRLALGIAALATTALALTGCGTTQAGAAATVGDTRITETQLTSEVQAVLEAKGQPLDTEDAGLVSQLLSRMITVELLDRLAVDEGVEVTQGQIDEVIANYTGQVGSIEQVEEIFLQENVAPSQIESLIRLQTQAQELGIKLNPSGSAEEQGTAVFEAASLLSDELDTTVSPRYGTWSAASLSVGPVPNDLSTLPSLPAEPTEG